MSNKTINQLPVANTIDAVNDYLPIYTANVVATQGINRNTYLGITGSPIGNSDIQTLTNKTIGITNTLTIKDTLFTLQDDGDTSKQAKFQLSGLTTATTRTYSLPDVTDTLVTLTATQTLANKTLTSPTISAPSITNATITADAYAGFSVSNTGTIYGISVATGVITTANSVNGTALTNSSITASKLNLGNVAAYVATSETTTSSTYTDLATTTDTVTATVGANGILQVSIYASAGNSGANTSYVSFALSGATTQAAIDNLAILVPGTSNFAMGATFTLTGLATGSTTVKMKYRVSGGTGTFLTRRISATPY